MTLLIGASLYDAQGDAAHRQAACVASLRALPNVALVNVQWADAPYVADGMPTVPVLRLDSNTETGARGPRKPIVSEIFDALADAADERACGWFAFTNADIVFSP